MIHNTMHMFRIILAFKQTELKQKEKRMINKRINKHIFSVVVVILVSNDC